MKSNKNKNRRLTGLRGLFITVCFTVGIVVWLATTAYVSKETEAQVRSALSRSGDDTASIWFELAGYQRSIFQASFLTQIHAKDEELEHVLSGLFFRTEVKHGPLVFNRTNLQFARVSFHSYLDKSRISENMKDVVARLFGDKDPLKGDLVVDYDLNHHYKFDISAFTYKTNDIVLNVSGGSMSGVIKSNSKEKSIKLEMDEIVFQQGSDTLKSLNNEFIYNLSGLVHNQLTASVTMTGSAKKGDVKYTGMSVNMDHLRLKQLLELLFLYEDRYSNEQQIEWTLEDAAQYQEGQDRLISLFYEKESLVLPEADLLVGQLFKQGVKDISFIRKIEDTELAYNK